MGWGGAGLGANEQGIAEPIKGGEVRKIAFNSPVYFSFTISCNRFELGT